MKNVRVGDRLVLRKDLEVGRYYGGVISDLTLMFHENMKDFEGNKIEKVDDNSVFAGSAFKGYYYTYEMLDLNYYKGLREKETVKDYKISMGGKLSTKSYTEKEAEMIYSLLKHDLKIDDVKFVYLG